jgi:hypothetical protein
MNPVVDIADGNGFIFGVVVLHVVPGGVDDKPLYR